MFGACRSCGSEDETFLICHIASDQDSCYFVVGNPLPLSHVWGGDKMFLIWHVTLRAHMIKGTCDLVSESSST